MSRSEADAARQPDSLSRRKVEIAMGLGRIAWWEMALPEGTVTCDDLKLEMLGRDPADFRGAHHTVFLELLHPEDREEAERAMADLLHGRSDRYEVDYRGRHAEGRWLWLHASGSVTGRDGEGRPVRVTGLVLDIDDRMRAEEEARRTREHFRLAFDTDLVAWAVTRRRDGTYLAVNPGFSEMTGWSPEEIIGRTSRELGFFTDETRRRLVADLEAGGTLHNRELTYPTRRGESRTMLFSIRPIAYEGEPCLAATMVDITGRKRTEEALRLSEAALNQAQELAGVGSFVVDLRTGRVHWSRHMFAIAGLEPGSFAGDLEKVIADLVHPEDLAEVQRQSAAMIEAGRTWPMEFRIRRPDGEVRWLRSGTRLESDGEGRPIRCVGVHHDITASRTVERILRAEREVGFRLARTDSLEKALDLCLETAIEVAGMDAGGIYLVEEETGDLVLVRCRGVKQAFEESAGRFSRDSDKGRAIMAGRPLHSPYEELSIATGAGKAEGIRALSIVPFLHGERVIGTLNVASHTLNTIPEHSRHAVEALALQIGGALGRIRDGRALAESEERYRTLAENYPDGALFLFDRDLRYTAVDGRELERVGLDPEEVVGRTVAEVFPELAPVVEPHARAVLAGEERSYQVTYRGRIYANTLIPVREREGKVVGGIAITRNITEQKRLEERIRQMEKMDAIGQLAGGVAHDFNNQLAAIMGYGEMLLHRLQDPELRRQAEGILVGARRAGDLTGQLLAFSRKGDRQARPVDMHGIIGEVTAILERSIDRRITIRQDLAAPERTVLGDPSQLQNALLNLGVNARDAMPAGGELTFATRNVELDRAACDQLAETLSPGLHLEVRVRDTGRGMSGEVRRRIFEPFFTTKQVGEGTGMGLAAVYGTVQQHQGAISVYSESGKGSSFVILLPLTALRAAAGERRELDPRALAGKRILVIEDEQILRDMLVHMLTGLGCEVRTAEDGQAGVEHYAAHWREVDLVILDMVMPRLSGRDAFHALRRVDPAVKVVIASGFSTGGGAEELLEQGAAGFLQKPFLRDRLVELLLENLAGAGGPGGALPAPPMLR